MNNAGKFLSLCPKCQNGYDCMIRSISSTEVNSFQYLSAEQAPGLLWRVWLSLTVCQSLHKDSATRKAYLDILAHHTLFFWSANKGQFHKMRGKKREGWKLALWAQWTMLFWVQSGTPLALNNHLLPKLSHIRTSSPEICLTCTRDLLRFSLSLANQRNKFGTVRQSATFKNYAQRLGRQ